MKTRIINKWIIYPIVGLLIVSSCQVNKIILEPNSSNNFESQKLSKEQIKFMNYYHPTFDDPFWVLRFNKEENILENPNNNINF